MVLNKTTYFLILLSALLFFSLGITKAQVRVDLKDLDKEIAHLSANQRASIYLECYDYFIKTDLLRAHQCNIKAFEILKTSKLYLKLAVCYHNFGYVNKVQSDYSGAIKNFNKSISLFEKVNNKIGLIESYTNLGAVYRHKQELNLAMQYYVKAYQLAEEIGYKNGIIQNTNNIGVVCLSQEHYDKAIYYFEKSISLRQEPSYFTLNNLGAAYKKKKNYPKALEYYHQSLKIIEQDKLQYHVAPLGNIGVIYTEQGKYKKALEYLKKSLQIEEKLNLKTDLIATYLNIGHVYRYKKELDTALIYYEKSMKLAKETSAKNTLVKIYTSMALTYEDAGEYVRAIDYLYELDRLNKELFDIEKNTQIEELLTKYEAENKEKELILLKKDKELKEIALANKHNELEKQKLLSELQAKKNESEILLLSSQNELQALNLQKKQIEAEKKEKEIVYLTKESELQKLKYEKRQAELKQRNVRKNVAIIGAGLIIIVAIILIVLYQQKLKTVELLNIKTEEVNKQRTYELLRDQEFSAIKAGVEGQEKERKRIAQDLHDGIGGNLASIKLNLVNITKDTENKDLLKVLKNIDDTYNEVRSISHNLVPSKIMNHAFIQLIQNFINEILDHKLLEVKFTAFPENELNLLPNEIKIEIYRIIQELMNNIVKYSKAMNVEIQLIKREGQVNLMVEDDGVGFDTSKFRSGIGLSNIRSRIEEMNGEVSIESSIGNWSLVNIEIPVETSVSV